MNCFTNKSLTKIFLKHNFYKFTKINLIKSHLKNRPYNLDKLKYFISDFKKDFISTSIKFISRENKEQ